MRAARALVYCMLALSQAWNKEQTDRLFEAARRFDLRWPVIADRLDLGASHPLPDIKHRFYTVTSKIIAARCACPVPAPCAPLHSHAPLCLSCSRGHSSVQSLKSYADFVFNADQDRKVCSPSHLPAVHLPRSLVCVSGAEAIALGPRVCANDTGTYRGGPFPARIATPALCAICIVVVLACVSVLQPLLHMLLCDVASFPAAVPRRSPSSESFDRLKAS